MGMSRILLGPSWGDESKFFVFAGRAGVSAGVVCHSPKKDACARALASLHVYTGNLSTLFALRTSRALPQPTQGGYVQGRQRYLVTSSTWYVRSASGRVPQTVHFGRWHSEHLILLGLLRFLKT